jgi:hypothetical protein
MAKTTTQRFQDCRKLVHEDAFETKLAAEIATPLLSGQLSKIGDHYDVGVFFRRMSTRYLSLVLSRLLDKPQNGQTGITASIASLIEMAQAETVLSSTEIQNFIAMFDKIKAAAAQELYNLPEALRDLRNIQLAHTLIPWNDPANDVLGHDLIDFANSIFEFVMELDRALTVATGIPLPDSRRATADFQSNVIRLYEALQG